MMTALVNGFVGLGLCIFLSTYFLGWTILDAAFCVLGSNVAGFCSVLITLHVGKVSKFIDARLKGALPTWTSLLGFYFSILLLMCPALRAWKPFFYLVGPLVFSTGFAIVLFGPVQDAIVRRGQRKAKKLFSVQSVML